MKQNFFQDSVLANESPIRFDGQVAIVTGAAMGLGPTHALELASRGAKVVVNDLGVARDGSAAAASAAEEVVAEIRALGGEATASIASVTDNDAAQKMVDETMRGWGRVESWSTTPASCATRASRRWPWRISGDR